MITVGFLGCGLIARAHAANLVRVREVVFGPVFDIDDQRADAFAHEFSGNAVRSADEVIAGADAVYVCTWTSAHPELVAAVVDAGKAVFCEKPLAVDLATAERMTAQVEAAGVVNQVGLVLRHSPAFNWLIEQLEGRRIMNIIFRDDQYLPTQGLYGSTWRGDHTLAGAGTLLEHSIHDLDLVHWMAGPLSVRAAVTGFVHGLDGIEDHATVLMTNDIGCQVTLVSVWHDLLTRPSQRLVEVFCTDAYFAIEGDWFGPVVWDTSESGTGEAQGRIERLDAGANPDGDFIAAVRDGRPGSPSFDTALAAHRLADSAYRVAQKPRS